MIRIAICEDEPILLNQLADTVKMILDKHSLSHTIDLFTNGGALLVREAFDLLLLDIAMEPLSGMDLARKLRTRGVDSKIIFITAHQQYAIDAYDVQASHYLVKPVDIPKLEAVLLKLCSSLKLQHKCAIAIRQGTAVRRIPFDQVFYLEVINRKIHLHTENESLPFYGKLEELEPSLPETFFRCHRSYIVNFDHVQRYDKKDVWLNNMERIPLSKRRYQAFGLEFMGYLKESGDVF